MLLPALQPLLGSGPVPWVTPDRAVAAAAAREGYRKLGIVGTRYLLESNVYPSALGEVGVEAVIPESLQNLLEVEPLGLTAIEREQVGPERRLK